MADGAKRVLIVEDLPTDAELNEREVRRVLPETVFLRVETREDFLNALASFLPDLILSDFKLPRFDGLSALKIALERAPELPFIVVTGSMNEDTAVECMKAGAWDYVIKEHIKRLGPAVLAAFEQKTINRQKALAEANSRSADTALRESEERFRRAVVDSPFPIMIHIEDGTVLQASNSWCEISGYSHEELASIDDWTERAYGERKASVQADIDALYRMDGPEHEGEYAIRGKSGKMLIWDFSSSPLGRLSDGRRLVISMATDVTERKRIEENSRMSEQKYRNIFDNAPLGIFQSTLDGKLISANSTFADMLGYSSPNKMIDQVMDIAGQHYVDPLARGKEVAIALRESGFVTLENAYRRVDGTTWIGRAHTHIIYDDSAKPLYHEGFVEDITERKKAEDENKKLEEQLQVSRKMEAIGSLAGGIAHDFNNLLCVILNYAESAMDKTRDEEEAIKSNLQEVMKAAERAAALTQQLLTFSRKQVLQTVAVDINQIAAGLEKMLRRILGEDIDFTQTLAPDLGIVQADPSQIEQVLMNLVVNARDAMPEGGKLIIETSDVELDGESAANHVDIRPGPYVLLTVTDSGFGMDEKTRARIFEPFFTTKEKGKGTGLGLSTVYGIVKQSAGSISVYSEPGIGTSFRVYFPRELSAKPVPLAHMKNPSKPPKGSETILVVDDEEAMRQLAARALAEAGYTVLNAANGDEALRVCEERAEDIHLLLTDVVMPNMGGRVLSERIAASRPAIKILYMSGYTDDAIVHHGALEAGTNFISKPFKAAALALKVREVLDSGAENGRAAERVGAGKDGLGAEERDIDPEELGALPPGFSDKMRKAIVSARYDEMLSLAETISADFPAAASTLKRLVKLFDYDGLREILNRTKEKKNGE